MDDVSDTVTVARGNLYEAFEVGRVFQHHWGRTVTESDAITFAAMTSQYNPVHFNVEYARGLGHPGLVVHPLLVYNIVLGLSVEDLSEAGGPFLGINDMRFPTPTYAGDTVYASSEVISKRTSNSRPGWGIVEWQSTGRNQSGDCVVSYNRRNLARLGEPEGS